jgi:transposase InsO family protein
MKFESILEFSTRFDVKKMCEVLDMNRSSYYRWLKGQKKREEKNLRERRDVELIEKVFLDSDKIFGYRNITKELKSQGVEISEYRVRRFMKENGFYPELAVKFKPVRNGKSDGRYCENKVKQEFKTDIRNTLWAGDITYIRTSVGWVYLAVVMDLHNREIIGYDVSRKIDTELAMRALGNAIGRRGRDDGLIFHSDRGSQYASKGYHQMLERNGIEGSMSRGGCPYDNSCVESFFASLKKEKIYRKKYDTIEDVKKDMFWYIEIFYNRKRRHSSLGYKTPVEYRMMNA